MAPSKPKNADPEVQFKKAQREADGKKAMAEYEAEAAATRIKTEKLRALRLARDAALGGSSAAGGKPAKKASKAPAKSSGKRKAVSLSDYQKDLDGTGRSR